MTKYLLDTTVLVDYLRGKREVVELVTGLAVAGNELGVCPINVAELYSGVSEKGRAIADKLVDSLAYWESTPETAKMAGTYRFLFARKGVTLTVTDALMAATAVRLGATLITANIRHYPMSEIALLPQP